MTAVRPPSPVNSAGESSASSTPSSSDTSSNGSDASDGAEGEGEIMGPGPISGIIEEGKLEYTSGELHGMFALLSFASLLSKHFFPHPLSFFILLCFCPLLDTNGVGNSL